MNTQTPAHPDLLVFPEWVAVTLYFAVVPLGLLVGYFAFRGFLRTNRRNAQLLALGLVLLTAVDTILGTSVEVTNPLNPSRVTPLVRAVVQLFGVMAIVYAVYRPDRSVANGSDGRPPSEDSVETPVAETDAPPDRTDPPDSEGIENAADVMDRDGEP